jgi:iron-sulfur cluster repair protein YtfE (RIC family)
MFHRRQFQIDLERDFHLRNQIMFEQQVQQRAEVALAQQQHKLLLSSPTFARHRQHLQQIEASLVQQINSPGISNNNNQSQTTLVQQGMMKYRMNHRHLLPNLILNRLATKKILTNSSAVQQ